MWWKRKTVVVDIGDGMEFTLFGDYTLGIAAIQHHTAGGFRFWAIINVRAREAIGFMFCNYKDIASVVEEIAARRVEPVHRVLV